MKNIIISISVFMLLAVSKPVCAQEFWEVVDMPECIIIHDVVFTHSNELIASVKLEDGNRIIRQSEPGADWDTIFYPGNDGIWTMIVDEFNNIYGVGRDLFSSFDNGESWNVLPIEILQMGTPALYKLSNSMLLIGTWGGIILSDTCGIQYSFVESASLNEVFNDFQYNQDSSIIFAGSTHYLENSGGIYRSFDNGLTWENSDLPGYFISSLGIDSQGNMYASSQGHYNLGYGGILKLGLENDIWEWVKKYEIATSLGITNSDEIYLGCSIDSWLGGVRLSKNYGTSWDTINSGLYSSNVQDIFIDREGLIYLKETSNPDILFRKTDTVVGIENGYSSPPYSIILFPNPADNRIYIKDDLQDEKSFYGNLRVYDQKGGLVLESLYKNDTELDISNLSNGVYYIVFNKSRRSYSTKFLKFSP